MEEVARLFRSLQLTVEAGLSLAAWQAAGAAYGRYSKRRRAAGGGSPRRIMADFLIGAHARSVGSLVTNDAAFFRREFPDLEVVEVRRP